MKAFTPFVALAFLFFSQLATSTSTTECVDGDSCADGSALLQRRIKRDRLATAPAAMEEEEDDAEEGEAEDEGEDPGLQFVSEDDAETKEVPDLASEDVPAPEVMEAEDDAVMGVDWTSLRQQEAKEEPEEDELFTHAIDAKAELAADGVALVSMTVGGTEHAFRMHATNMYGETGAIKFVGKDGEIKGTPLKFFRSAERRHGMRAVAMLHRDGAVSGVFPVGGRALRVRPVSKVPVSLLAAEAKGTRASHVAQVLDFFGHQVGSTTTAAPGAATTTDATTTAAGGTTSMTPFGGDSGPNDILEPLPGQDDPDVLPWNGTRFYPGCFPGDDQLHVYSMRMSADVKAYELYGGEAIQEEVEIALAETTYIYEHQMNLALQISEFVIYMDNEAAPDYGKDDCGDTLDRFMFDKLGKMAASGSQAGAGVGAEHIFTGCGKGWGVIGLAWVGTACSSSTRHNTAINQMKSRKLWYVFAHELGHNFGAGHNQCGSLGEEKDGGLMGCGNGGRVEGVVQFNPYHTRHQICDRFKSQIHKCIPKKMWPATAPGMGLHTEFYYSSGVTSMPDLAHVTPDLIGLDDVVSYADATAFSGLAQQTDFMARWKGGILITEGGSYTFTISSDDGSRLYIDGLEVISNDHSDSVESKSGTINLIAGLHSLVLIYYQNVGEASMTMEYSGPDSGGASMVVPQDVLRTEARGANLHIFYLSAKPEHCVLPDFAGLVPDLTRVDDNMMIWTTSNTWAGLSQKDYYLARWISGVKILEPGNYTFYLRSDDGSMLFVDGLPAVMNEGCHGFDTATGVVELTTGEHLIVVHYFEATGGAGMYLQYSGPDTEDLKSAIPNTYLDATMIETTTTTTTTVTTTTTTTTTTAVYVGPNGLNAEFYYWPTSCPGDWKTMPDMSGMVPNVTRLDAKVEYKNTWGKFTGLGQSNNVVGRWTGSVVISTPGTYTFFLRSNDGAILYMNGAQLVNYDGTHGCWTKQTTSYFDAGVYPIELQYFECSGWACIYLQYSGPDTGGQKVAIPESALRPTNASVAAPSGLSAKFYYIPSGTKWVPDFSALTPDVTRIDAVVNYKNHWDYWGGLTKRDNYAAQWTGGLQISRSGTYTFSIKCDDGCNFYINKVQFINNDGLHGLRTRTCTVDLDAGMHPIEVEYFEAGGWQGMYFEYSGPDTNDEKVVVPQAVLDPTVTSTGATNGILAEFFYIDEGAQSVPDMSNFSSPDVSRIESQVFYKNSGSTWAGLTRGDNYAARWSANLQITTPGDYFFMTGSSDGSLLFINGEEVVNNDGRHGMKYKSGSIELSAGSHPLLITFFEASGWQGMILMYNGPDTGFLTKVVPADVLTPP